MNDARDGFPDGFLWGTASSAYQCEGGNEWSDWHAAEAREAGRAPAERRLAESCGAAADFWNRYPGDLDIARELGARIHRVSVEWSRVMPTPGGPNPEALDRYREILLAMRERGIAPMVCLHHFTLPVWLAAKGGLSARGTVLREFGRFVRLVAERLGDLASWWVTVNEPGILASCSYLAGTFPPFRKNYAEFLRALGTLSAMHRLASGILREAVPGARVGFAHAYQYVLPWHPPCLKEKALAGLVSAHMNGFAFAGIPRDSVDFVGINYYGPNYVKGFSLRTARDGDPVTDMGWSIRPEGLKVALSHAWRRFGKPLLVTENGMATGDDGRRIAYIRDHLGAVLDAIRAGIPVKGYMYWALTDNFEWAEGFSKRFGLVGVDYETQGRAVRPSGRWFAEAAKTGRIPPIPGGS